MASQTVLYAGIVWHVSYDYSPPVRGRHTLPNGDPGYPDDPEEIDLLEVYLEGSQEDILEFLTPDTLEHLEGSISEVEAGYRSQGDL